MLKKYYNDFVKVDEPLFRDYASRIGLTNAGEYARELTRALYSYLKIWGQTKDEKEALESLSKKPFNFIVSPGSDTQAAMEGPALQKKGYYLSSLLYTEILVDHYAWRLYFDLLTWYHENKEALE